MEIEEYGIMGEIHDKYKNIADELNGELREKYGETRNNFTFISNPDVGEFSFGLWPLLMIKRYNLRDVEENNRYDWVKNCVKEEYNKWIDEMNKLKL